MDDQNPLLSDPGSDSPNVISPPGETIAPESPSTIRVIFMGPTGIRAGWRFSLYLLIAAAVSLALGFILQGWHPEGTVRLWKQYVFGEAVGLIGAVVAALIMARIENRPFAIYGLPPGNAFGKPFWIGVVWGLVSITLLLVAIRALNGFYFGHLALHGLRIIKFGLFWGLFFLLVGLSEEFLLRGYTQFTLSTGIGFWPTAAALSTLFGAIHLGNKGENLAGALGAAGIGMFFCLTLRRTGTLWFAVGMHASWDWGESFLYSVPDSGMIVPGHFLNSSFQGATWLTGGSVGPEASLFVFVVIALMWLLFDRLYPQVKYAP